MKNFARMSALALTLAATFALSNVTPALPGHSPAKTTVAEAPNTCPPPLLVCAFDGGSVNQ